MEKRVQLEVSFSVFLTVRNHKNMQKDEIIFWARYDYNITKFCSGIIKESIADNNKEIISITAPGTTVTYL